MRRAALPLLTLIVFLTILTSCSGGSKSDNSSTTTTKKPSSVVTTYPPTTLVPNVDPRKDDYEVKTFSVKPWGTTVYSEDGTMSLQAVGFDFGDNASRSSYKLCAVGADVPLSDVGYGNSPIDLMVLPKPGATLSADQQNKVPGNFITIDDSKTSLVASVQDHTLERLLLKGHCTDVEVDMLTGSSANAVVGFSHWTIPFAEFRVDGEFTYLERGRDAALEVKYEYFVN